VFDLSTGDAASTAAAGVVERQAVKPPESEASAVDRIPVSISVDAKCSPCNHGASNSGGLWRFVLINLLPTTALVVFVLSLLGSGLPIHRVDRERLSVAITALSLREVTLLTLAILAVAWISSPLQFSLVRLLEGYWHGPGLRQVGLIGVRLQARQLRRLVDVTYSADGQDEQRQELAKERLATYPAEGRLLPTRLGNVLRAAEDEAGQRYGLDTITMMPRLYPFLSERLTDGLAELRDQLDITARLCVTLLLATVISALLLLPQLLLHGWWLALPVATAVLAWVAYKAAVQAATAYGRLLYVAFDLHRFDMVRGLHLPLPNAGKEEDFNQRLSEFFAKRRWVRYVDPAEYRYEHPSDLTTTPTANGVRTS
jgi:hypothetical protein